MVQPSMAAEIAVANGHDAPTDADHREAQDYAVAVLFVLQLDYPKLSNDQLDYENKYHMSLAAACEIFHLRGPESSHPDHQADVAFTNVAAGAWT